MIHEVTPGDTVAVINSCSDFHKDVETSVLIDYIRNKDSRVIVVPLSEFQDTLNAGKYVANDFIRFIKL